MATRSVGVLIAALVSLAGAAHAQPDVAPPGRPTVRDVAGPAAAPAAPGRLWRRPAVETDYARLLAASSLSAQRSDDASAQARPPSTFCRCCPCRTRRGWHVTLSLPVWVPGVSGSFASGSAEASTEGALKPGAKPVAPRDRAVSFPELGAGLQFAFVGGLEVRHERWVFLFDAFGVRLGSNTDFERLGRDVDASVSAGLGRVAIGYRLHECVVPTPCWWQAPSCFCLDAYVGARIHWAKIRIEGSEDVADVDRSRTWVDPIVGLQAEWALTPRFVLVARGDVGGFGASSNLEWMLSVGLQWRFTRRDSLTLGASAYRTFFERGVGDQRFRFDLTLRGPSLVYSHRF